jgi:AbrB family looped-hinge helix DNA binding protein
MRITVKGQVTIPRPIRDKLDLSPGDSVSFIERGDDVLVRKDRPETRAERLAKIDAWIERVRGTADAGWTTDEILDMTRGADRRPGPRDEAK